MQNCTSAEPTVKIYLITQPTTCYLCTYVAMCSYTVAQYCVKLHAVKQPGTISQWEFLFLICMIHIYIAISLDSKLQSGYSYIECCPKNYVQGGSVQVSSGLISVISISEKVIALLVHM